MFETCQSVLFSSDLKSNHTPVTDSNQEIVQKPVLEQEATNVETPVDTQSTAPENIIPLSSVIEDRVDPLEAQLQANMNQMKTPVENVSPLQSSVSTVVKLIDKVVPNKIARATKKKINEVIKPKFDGTYTKRDIITSSSPSNDSNQPFNLENFVTNKAA